MVNINSSPLQFRPQLLRDGSAGRNRDVEFDNSRRDETPLENNQTVADNNDAARVNASVESVASVQQSQTTSFRQQPGYNDLPLRSRNALDSYTQNLPSPVDIAGVQLVGVDIFI